MLLNFLFAQSFLLGSVTNLTFSQLWPKNSHKVVNYMWFLNSFLQRKIIYLIVETPEIKFLKHSFCLRLFYTIEFLLTQHKKKKLFKVLFKKGCSKRLLWIVNTLFWPKNSKLVKVLRRDYFRKKKFQIRLTSTRP